jgi:hypothetical protein
MRYQFAILLAGTFLLAGVGHPALARADGLMFGDQSIAAAVNNSIAIDEACRPSPYALYRQTCVSNELNVNLERSPFETLTWLDHFALFVHKHKDLKASQQLIPGIKFKMKLGLANIYQQEAKLEARLQVRW